MGRILEALKQADAKRCLPGNGTALHDQRSEHSAETRVEEIEEIPFIEVGGPKTPLEASASVLACNPSPNRRRKSVKKQVACL